MGGILPSMVSLRSAGKAGPSKLADPNAGSAPPPYAAALARVPKAPPASPPQVPITPPAPPPRVSRTSPAPPLRVLKMSQLLSIELRSPSLDKGSISRRLHAAVVTAGAKRLLRLVLVKRQLLFLSQLLNIELRSPSLDNGSISRRLYAAVVTATVVTAGAKRLLRLELVHRQLLLLSELLNIDLRSLLSTMVPSPADFMPRSSLPVPSPTVFLGPSTHCTACLSTIFLVLTLARSSVFFDTACRFALAWKHVSHAPHWPVVSIPIITVVFLVMSSLGCASMRWTYMTSRDALALSAAPEAIFTNPFSVRFASRAACCLGIRLVPVAENSSLRGQNFKNKRFLPGEPQNGFISVVD